MTVATGGRLVEMVSAFISRPSPQNDVDAVRAFIRDAVQPALPEGYFDAISIDADGNLVALRRGPGGGRPLLLCTYGATFPAEAMERPYEPALVGEGATRLRGRGVCEQKAALGAAIEAVNMAAEHAVAPRDGLLFVTTVAGEMGSHEVVGAMADRGELEAGMGIIVMGTGSRLCLGNMGRVDVWIDVIGEPAHSSDPSRGLNAIDGAVRVIERLRDVRMPSDPELGQATLTPTGIETSPRAMHTVPGHARLVYDRRLVPGDTVRAAVDELRHAIGSIEPFGVTVASGRFNLPNKVQREERIARVVGRAIADAGGDATPTYMRSTLDGGFFTDRGVPTVLYGPGEVRFAHTDEEYVEVADIQTAARVYYRTLELLS